jgi:hypothetical protein
MSTTTTTSSSIASSIASTITSSVASVLSTDAASATDTATLAPPFVPLVAYNNSPSETGGDSLTQDLTIFYDVSGDSAG